MRRRFRLAVGGLIFLLAWGLLLLLVSAPSIVHGTLSGYQIFDWVIISFVVVFGVGLLLPAARRLKEGAQRLSIDPLGFDLEYSDGKSVRTLWASSGLRFDLLDLSAVDAARLRLPEYRHFIRVHGVETPLTPHAYLAMIDQIAQRNLVDTVGPARRGIFPPDPTYAIHHVRARRPG